MSTSAALRSRIRPCRRRRMRVWRRLAWVSLALSSKDLFSKLAPGNVTVKSPKTRPTSKGTRVPRRPGDPSS
eukprot:7200042-Alexandrium_andersonii.AAC.1